MKTKISAFTLLALAVGGAACTDLDDDADPRDEDVITDGKSDAFGITEGSPEAIGILELANEADRNTLRYHVGLAENATVQLLAHRAGPDTAHGTADDDPFDTLVELDHVSFIGTQAFTKLLAYARANGYVPMQPAGNDDPFDPASCSGAPMTLAEIDAHQGDLALYQFAIRERDCKRNQGGSPTCTAWHDKPVSSLSWSPAASGTALLGKTSGGDRMLWMYAQRHCPSGSARTWSGTSCSGLGAALTCYTYTACDGKPYPLYSSTSVLDDRPYIRFTGNLTNRCLRVTANVDHEWLFSDTTDYSEAEVAVLARF